MAADRSFFDHYTFADFGVGKFGKNKRIRGFQGGSLELEDF